jgi:hypothetical protein
MALGTLMGGLIGGLGNSAAARTSTGTSTSTSTKTPTYSPAQTNTQSSVATLLQNLLGGGSSPEIQAMQTQSADQINKNYSGLGDRMNKFLAARGFGQSGKVGQMAEQNELSRQGALAGNTSNFANTALNEQNTALSDALNFSFANPGGVSNSTGATSSTAAGSGLASALSGAFSGFNSGLNQSALLGGFNNP